MRLTRLFKLFLILSVFVSCEREADVYLQNISLILDPYFKEIPSSYEVLILKNKDCLSCEKSTAEYVNSIYNSKRNLFIIAQEIREVEKKKFYEEKPFILNTNTPHVFSDSLGKIICEKIDMGLKTTILIKVDNDSIASTVYLRERYSVEEVKK